MEVIDKEINEPDEVELIWIVNDIDYEDCNVQEQILVPRTLLDPQVRVGMKLEELLGLEPPADKVSGHNQVMQLLCIFLFHGFFFIQSWSNSYLAFDLNVLLGE